MELLLIAKAVLAMGGSGLVIGVLLGVASKKFAVEIDPRIEKIREALPGTNCGACGLPGCDVMAEAMADGRQPPEACVAGGAAVAKAVAEVMGIDACVVVKRIARVLCQGGAKECSFLADYQGIKTCRGAVLAAGGGKACSYGCLGLGSCVYACPYDAISINENKIPVIDEDKCTACGLCVQACPKNLFELVVSDKRVVIRCSSKDKGPVVKKICAVGCIGCGLCVKACPLDAISLKDNLAVINYEKCDNCGLCIEKCPMNSILKYEFSSKTMSRN
ncbi:MAG: RnfABCDGE type electron transport complex subunit B [Actinobacteria bacterium]|nr:RnfABCDGE type electron transport complex subunit B [Actinomycetota bacterium]